MFGASTIAVCISRFKITASARALRVDCTTDALPNLSDQRTAAGLWLLSAVHCHMIGTNRNGAIVWDAPLWMGIGFSPIKRHPKRGAARTAA